MMYMEKEEKGKENQRKIIWVAQLFLNKAMYAYGKECEKSYAKMTETITSRNPTSGTGLVHYYA